MLADTIHSAEMWQEGNKDNFNARLADEMPERWDRLQAIRNSGRLSCDPEYQRIEGESPLAMSYFYDPNNVSRPGDGAIDLKPDVYCQIAGSDAPLSRVAARLTLTVR